MLELVFIHFDECDVDGGDVDEGDVQRAGPSSNPAWQRPRLLTRLPSSSSLATRSGFRFTDTTTFTQIGRSPFRTFTSPRLDLYSISMADVISSPPPATALSPRKRPAPTDESPRRVPLNTKGSQFMMPTPPDTEESSNASPDGSVKNEERKRATSPALSCSTIESSTEVVSSNAVTNSSTTTTTATQSTAPGSTSSSGPPPAKRRKLTPGEKLEQAQAKEAKAREAAEKKALAEQKKADAAAEKAKKAEEKARKDEERAAEKRAKAEEKEAKQREKELEEERKAQEKLAKERKQMKLGAFFGGKPSTPAKGKGTSEGEEQQLRSSRISLSHEPFGAVAVADGIKAAASPAKGTTSPPPSSKKPAVADYRRTFLPFQLPPTATLAQLPHHSEADQGRFDHELNDPSIQEKYDLGLVTSYASVSNYFTAESKNNRGCGYPDIEKVVDRLRGVSKHPIDLTGDNEAEPGVDVLSRIPIRHIHFNEDVRPAFVGTYTKIRSPRAVRKVRRNPFTKARPDTNYDEDSEAEWEEPEEGDEEILDDDEDEGDSQADAGEMDDFLDDEEDIKNKRKLITDSLVPENTGLCWENDSGQVQIVDGVEVHQQPEAMSGMRLGFLVPGFSDATIDPFSTIYWEKPAPVPVQPVVSISVETPTSTGLMAPPRQPLQPKLNFSGIQPAHELIGAAEGQKGPITSLAASQAAKRGPKPSPKTLSKEDLDEFKEAVIGSPLGKLDLQKGLKNR